MPNKMGPVGNSHKVSNPYEIRKLDSEPLKNPEKLKRLEPMKKLERLANPKSNSGAGYFFACTTTNSVGFRKP